MSNRSVHVSSNGTGLGGVVGMVIAGYISHAIVGNPLGWVIIHIFLNWLYVIYALFAYSDKLF